MPPLPDAIDRAYRQCLQETRTHYENFPVASYLLPPRLRRPVAAIYSFARRGDDLSDEGNAPPAARLQALDDLGRRLDAAAAGTPDDDPTFIALAHAMAVHHLPPDPFHDLLQAFRRDITQRRYEDFADLESYCRCSANPVGRLLLHLCDRADPERIAFSDAVCTALQLINFYQDLAQDFHELGRIYIPRDEMRAFGVGEDHFRHRITDDAFRALMHHQFQRAGERLHRGAPLGAMLPGRIGLEIRLIIAAGGRVLTRLRRQETDLFSRPRLRGGDFTFILLRALAGRA
ncbi:MAG: squalene synthase HpnC [Ectothiorhodospira sp.]